MVESVEEEEREAEEGGNKILLLSFSFSFLLERAAVSARALRATALIGSVPVQGAEGARGRCK
jgi:hypothetical protein